MTPETIHVCADAEAAARDAAELIAARIREVTTAQVGRRFQMAVSGGHTPIAMFAALAQYELPWPRIDIFQVDERVAPLGDSQRNLTALHDALGASGATIMAMPVDEDDLAGAAVRYESQLPASFDLIHLGIGTNGHTASLFPGDAATGVVDRDVTMTGAVHAGFMRMTLTFRVLARAGEIVWLIAGSEKATPLQQLVAGDMLIPAAHVSNSRVTIVADVAAASLLTPVQREQGIHH